MDTSAIMFYGARICTLALFRDKAVRFYRIFQKKKEFIFLIVLYSFQV